MNKLKVFKNILTIEDERDELILSMMNYLKIINSKDLGEIDIYHLEESQIKAIRSIYIQSVNLNYDLPSTMQEISMEWIGGIQDINIGDFGIAQLYDISVRFGVYVDDFVIDKNREEKELIVKTLDNVPIFILILEEFIRIGIVKDDISIFAGYYTIISAINIASTIPIIGIAEEKADADPIFRKVKYVEVERDFREAREYDIRNYYIYINTDKYKNLQKLIKKKTGPYRGSVRIQMLVNIYHTLFSLKGMTIGGMNGVQNSSFPYSDIEKILKDKHITTKLTPLIAFIDSISLGIQIAETGKEKGKGKEK